MESKSITDIRHILENIRRHFDFLFRRGFRIASVLFVDPGNEKWQVVVTAGEHLIRIHGCKGEAGVGLSSLELCNEVGFIKLHDLICLIEPETHDFHIPEALSLDPSNGLTRMAGLLEKYLDDIWVLMDKIHRGFSISKVRAIAENNCPDFFVASF